jgi:hypothetical protein
MVVLLMPAMKSDWLLSSVIRITISLKLQRVVKAECKADQMHVSPQI